MKTIYIVWIGGLIDLETADLEHAQSVLFEWRRKGYDDAQIETAQNLPTTI